MMNYIISEKQDSNVSGKFRLVQNLRESSEAIVLDTYDYLLVKKQMCLLKMKNGSLKLYKGDEVLEFKDFNEALFSEIDSIISPRVLLEKLSLTIETSDAILYDELDKTIAKGDSIAVSSGNAYCAGIFVEPLRGYAKETADGLSFIGAKEAEGSSDIIMKTIEMTGDPLLSYSSKPIIKLQPEEPLAEVMRDIFTHLIKVMQLNVQGIVDDVDIEFLHDFRVSVRRLRSAMSLVRGAFVKEGEKEFRARFRQLGGVTGIARDMDVYLYGMPEYKKMLPDWMKGGMDELAEYFQKVREEEYKKLAVYLQSEEYSKLIADWEEFLYSVENITAKGRKPVLSIAKKSIFAAFEEIDKQASVLTVESHSDAVHDIRISFKKIRYLLEFFASLFDKEKITPMLKEMKVLQDSLGDHNDYYVQQLNLQELISKDSWSDQTAAACGFLSAKLEEKQAAERVKALELIIDFMKYRGLFRELCK